MPRQDSVCQHHVRGAAIFKRIKSSCPSIAAESENISISAFTLTPHLHPPRLHRWTLKRAR